MILQAQPMSWRSRRRTSRGSRSASSYGPPKPCLISFSRLARLARDRPGRPCGTNRDPSDAGGTSGSSAPDWRRRKRRRGRTCRSSPRELGRRTSPRRVGGTYSCKIATASGVRHRWTSRCCPELRGARWWICSMISKLRLGSAGARCRICSDHVALSGLAASAGRFRSLPWTARRYPISQSSQLNSIGDLAPAEARRVIDKADR